MTVLKTERARLWRYGAAVALVFMPLLWAFFGAMLALLHRLTGWPDGEALRILAPTALIASLVPVALLVVDYVAGQHGSIAIKGLKIDFAQATP